LLLEWVGAWPLFAATITRRVTPEAGRAKRVGPGHPESHEWWLQCSVPW